MMPIYFDLMVLRGRNLTLLNLLRSGSDPAGGGAERSDSRFQIQIYCILPLQSPLCWCSRMRNRNPLPDSRVGIMSQWVRTREHKNTLPLFAGESPSKWVQMKSEGSAHYSCCFHFGVLCLCNRQKPQTWVTSRRYYPHFSLQRFSDFDPG